MTAYHKFAEEYHMNRRLFPLALGTLQIGLLGVSTYVLCSMDALNGISLYLPH